MAMLWTNCIRNSSAMMRIGSSVTIATRGQPSCLFTALQQNPDNGKGITQSTNSEKHSVAPCQTQSMLNSGCKICVKNVHTATKVHPNSSILSRTVSQIPKARYGVVPSSSALPSGRSLMKSFHTSCTNHSADDDKSSSSAPESGGNHGNQQEEEVDIDSELLRYDYDDVVDFRVAEVEEMPERTSVVGLERGKTGVYDIEEIVALLQNENVSDICVIRVPPETKYVDYMVLATCNSTRHMGATAEEIKWVYKRRRHKRDKPSVKIEGYQSRDWYAMDMQNIAVHLFLPDTRELYDLETLWTVGPKYDRKCQEVQKDLYADILGAPLDMRYPVEGQDIGNRYQEVGQESLDSATGWHQTDNRKR